ncbi:MAG: M3 family oligoendopeptidase, partial [Bacteroidota bacterium]
MSLVIEVPKRSFLPADLKIDSWESISGFYEDLEKRSLDSESAFHGWLKDLSELETVVQEHVGWLYIRMTCDTSDEQLTSAYTFFINEINPHIEPVADRLNKKLAACPFTASLGVEYGIYLRQVRNAIELFREVNVPLNAELSVKEQKYGEIAGAMSVDVNGKELTLQQASNFLRDPDRSKRESVYRSITSRRLTDRDKLDGLFNELIALRHQVAINAGFENYRDYKFRELDRFDYSVSDCESFHVSVSNEVVPLLRGISEARSKARGLVKLRPWDLEVDTNGRPDLKPFRNGEELASKTISCFSEIDPYFGSVVRTLHERKYMDLDSRIGKAPGGYNYPLYESGVPFIFMNASGSLRDVITMVHEGGHAIHSMLTRDLPFIGFKEFPSEVAELASMSMELISMEHWQHFFEDAEELKRARQEQLENVIEALPWIICIDRFQHWLYTHPMHTNSDRTDFWLKNLSMFSDGLTDWSGFEATRESIWQKQLHLFEVPFYYIEYGMAQLGAIAVWRNYRQNPKMAIESYKRALALGHTCSISDVYKAAGVSFDFSSDYIRDLMLFVK